LPLLCGGWVQGEEEREQEPRLHRCLYSPGMVRNRQGVGLLAPEHSPAERRRLDDFSGGCVGMHPCGGSDGACRTH
jgi:hypothetical protein